MAVDAGSAGALGATTANLTGRQKVAALLISLGTEISSSLLGRFNERDVDRVTVEILRMQKIPSAVLDAVQAEFYEMLRVDESLAAGGVDYAREILERALGDKGGEVMERILAGSQSLPFDFIRNTDGMQLLNFIQNEHPQTIALVLSHINPLQAATILAGLAPELQADVSRRIATMGQISPEVIRQDESSLREKMSSLIVEDVSSSGGVEYLVKVIQNVDRGTEKSILEQLDETAPELSDEIRKGMFLFEDVSEIDDRSIQRIMRDIDGKDTTLALRGASEELKDAFFRNMSSRAAEILREEMELSGPVRLRNVEEAQQRIVNVIRKLEEAEEIVISRGGEADQLV